MSEPATALERREPVAIDAILGRGDIRAMVDQARDNANVAIEIARGRGFVTDFDVKDKAGQVIGTRPFFHLATWQLMAQAWGITAYTEGVPTEVKPGTWQAAAVAAVVETGRVIGRAVAMCSKTEPGRKYATDHVLSGTAQSRAQRNAIRSCLGSLLIAAGVDFPDPEAPLTDDQRRMIYALEAELGLTHEQGHEDAGVSSYTELTREQASEVIDRWQQRRQAGPTAQGTERPSGEDIGSSPLRGPADDQSEPGQVGSDSDQGGPGEAGNVRGKGKAATPATPEPAPSEDAPASSVAWERATKAGLTSRKALAIAKGLGYDATSASDITGGQLAKVLAHYVDRSEQA